MKLNVDLYEAFEQKILFATVCHHFKKIRFCSENVKLPSEFQLSACSARSNIKSTSESSLEIKSYSR